jgi:hypothetical protein
VYDGEINKPYETLDRRRKSRGKEAPEYYEKECFRRPINERNTRRA